MPHKNVQPYIIAPVQPAQEVRPYSAPVGPIDPHSYRGRCINLRL